jgi:hypothetical protein
MKKKQEMIPVEGGEKRDLVSFVQQDTAAQLEIKRHVMTQPEFRDLSPENINKLWQGVKYLFARTDLALEKSSVSLEEFALDLFDLVYTNPPTISIHGKIEVDEDRLWQ